MAYRGARSPVRERRLLRGGSSLTSVVRSMRTHSGLSPQRSITNLLANVLKYKKSGQQVTTLNFFRDEIT